MSKKGKKKFKIMELLDSLNTASFLATQPAAAEEEEEEAACTQLVQKCIQNSKNSLALVGAGLR